MDPKCIYSKAKIMGTLVCLAGAVSMNLLQYSPLSPSMTTQDSVFLYNNFSNQVMGTRRIIGSMYLLAAIFIVSCTMVLQVVQSQNLYWLLVVSFCCFVCSYCFSREMIISVHTQIIILSIVGLDFTSFTLEKLMITDSSLFTPYANCWFSMITTNIL